MTRSRTITWNDPVESAAYGHGLTGLEFLHRQTSGLIPAAPVADLIGLRGTYVMPGRVTFEYEPREEHYSSLGAVHGGIVTAVLDTAMCAAIQSVLDADVGLATVELRTSFVRPVTLTTDVFRVEGTVVHAGSRLATAEARLVDRAGVLYATASSSALVLAHEQKHSSLGWSRRVESWRPTAQRSSRVAARGLELSGMEYIRAIFGGELPAPPIAELMGFRGVEAEPGRAVFEMEPGPGALQPDRLGARRRRADAPRLGDGLRRAHAARGGRPLHDARGEDELRPPDHGGHRADPLRGNRAAQGLADRDRRREAHGRLRPVAGARHDHLLDHVAR